MTSQPGSMPPGTTGHEGTSGGGSRPTLAEQWLVRLLPLMLLIILGLAGLRGAVATPRWDGPLHRDGLVIGLVLEVVLGALLVITIWRRSAGVDAQGPAPRRLTQWRSSSAGCSSSCSPRG